MNDQGDRQDETMEELLRQWGADQAVRKVIVPPAPVAVRSGGSKVVAVIAWFSTVAAAGVLLAVGISFFAPDFLAQEESPRSPRQAKAPEPTAAAAPARLPARRTRRLGRGPGRPGATTAAAAPEHHNGCHQSQ